MTNRVLVLSLFLTRTLFRTLLGVLPPVLTLLLYRLTFTYRHQGDPAYLTAVGGLGLACVGVVTALLVADRANRAALYPLIARLPHRAELLAAVAVSTVLITIGMAILYVSLVLGLQHMTLTPEQLLPIVPRWLVVFVFAATLGLMMGRLASRRGSHVVVFTVLGLMALSREQLRFLNVGESAWLVEAAELVARPVTDSLTANDAFQILPALAVTGLYAIALFALAVGLFRGKDLIWTE